ncbi:MAG: 3-hydroxyacyl-CoA dehydrogenase NAD-binding domain-containing protein, partial [Acetobacteraceae bacterium]
MNVQRESAVAAVDLETETPAISAVGVIGAGQMGNGIAHVAALAGLQVTMLDVAPKVLEKALATINHNMDRQVGRKIITKADKAAALARITTTADYAA